MPSPADKLRLFELLYEAKEALTEEKAAALEKGLMLEIIEGHLALRRLRDF